MSAAARNSYRAIYEAHEGYVSHKMTHYPFAYDKILKPLLNVGKPVRLLEIGVQNGGSLEIWKKYLPEGSEIHGVDIDENCLQLKFPENVYFHLGSAADQAFMNRTFANGFFDIILDDGSHVCSDIISTFINLFPRLAPGGVYLAEDLHASYWANFGGGFRRNDAAIEFFKNLADIVNLDYIPENALKEFSDSPLLSQDFRSMVEGVSFYDSICAVTKFHAPKTEPFLCVLAGNSAQVTPIPEECFLESQAEAIKRLLQPWTVRCSHQLWRDRQHGEIFSSALQKVENMHCGLPLAMNEAYISPHPPPLFQIPYPFPRSRKA